MKNNDQLTPRQRIIAVARNLATMAEVGELANLPEDTIAEITNIQIKLLALAKTMQNNEKDITLYA